MLVPLIFLAALCSVAIAQTNSTLVQEIGTALGSATDCSSCGALLSTLKEVAILGDDAFVDAFTAVCIASKVRLLRFTIIFCDLTLI